MSTRSAVAVLRTQPETVLQDYERLAELAGMKAALDPGATTIIKDNISWHYPMPSANTTPWQLEGAILALRHAGFADLVAVQNKTVVIDAFKGQDLNHYVPIFRHYNIPVLFNFRPEDMKWIKYQPKGKLLALDRIFPEGIRLPDYFLGKNIVHLPTTKCVAGDTELVLADGSLVTARELVHRQMAIAPDVMVDNDGDRRVAGDIALLAMDATGHIGSHAATGFWRTATRGRCILRARTRTGRTLTATVDHPVFTPEGWTPLGNLAIGSRVAIARRLKINGSSQPLPQAAAEKAALVIARGGRKHTAAFAQHVIDRYQAGSTATAIAAEESVAWQTIQAILNRHHVPIRGNVTQLKIPEKTSPDFWRWIGYVMAEGCIERGKTTDKLWWVNSEPAIRQDFIRLTRELFDLVPREHSNGKHLYIYSRNLGSFFEELGLPVPLRAGNKHTPTLLFRCPDEEIAAFLSAYLDGDGCVSSKQTELTVTTKSRQLAHDVQVLFARLGAIAFCKPVQRTIPGKWDAPRIYYFVTVSADDLARLAPYLQFKHPRKRLLLEQQMRRFEASKQPSNWDIVPFPPDLFRSVRTGLGLTQAATGKPSSVNTLENEHGQLTPRIARYFVNLFQEHDKQGRFADEIAHLRALANEELAWDTVEAIEAMPEEEAELFDVTVPETDSFIGNGWVIHNCHIYTTTTGAMKNAFGGLLSHHRHYTHTWIHETLVDLLTIQKEIHTGLFAMMDGTTAGNGPGPRTMLPVVKNVILASADQTAIDAVAAKLMGFDPLTIPYIRLAHENKLGVGDVREIDIVGDEDVAQENWHFEVGHNFHQFLGWLSWYGPTKVLQRLIFHTPIVNIPIFVSEFNHDYVHWPLKERGLYMKWRAETQWGQLFDRYEREEHLADEAPVAREPARAVA